MKEEEKIERTIRGLLKLPENRRCINCNSLGPQYVCTTFNTFVCTNCGGIHREFTHRVKSVSMAKFNAEEVSALQAGGNERARQIYFKEWNSQRNSYPDGSNLYRLRDFIKHVYVDRKYTGERIAEDLHERSTEKLARLRLRDKEGCNESRKVNAYGSPSYEDRCELNGRSGTARRSEDRSFRYYYDERRSPRYAPGSSRNGGFKRSPARFEIVDDRFRDDGFGRRRQSDSRRFSNSESRVGNKSPERQNSVDQFTSSVVRPAKDILGENGQPIRAGESSKENNRNGTEDRIQNQNTASYGKPGSVDGNHQEIKAQNSESLIDFNSEPEPSNAAAAQIQQGHSANVSGNSSSSEFSAPEKARQAPITNTLESLLFELSVPSFPPVGNAPEIPSSNNAPSTASKCYVPEGNVSAAAPAEQMPRSFLSSGASRTPSTTNEATQPPLSALEGHISDSTLFDNFTDSRTAISTNLSVQPSNDVPLQAEHDFTSDSTVKVPDAQQISSVQQNQPSASPLANSNSAVQETARPMESINNQPYTPSDVAKAQLDSDPSAELSFPGISVLTQETGSGVESKTTIQAEAKSTGRKELPADLFTATYSAAPASFQGWQTYQPHVGGYNMQHYPNSMMPAYPNAAKSANPFDLNSEVAGVQSPPFPSIVPLQGADADVSVPTGLGPNAHLSGMIPQSHSYASAVPPGAYMGQQSHHYTTPSRPQGVGGGAAFGSFDMAQQLTGRYSNCSPDSFTSPGGNPFG
ncbi:probable ADP-ribosylation factor GTPase-activating protein AGD14 isoform X2 [Tripterygium wilfordii]|uniref:probable ADP-ribosylation factor GTPase-activating protein AGD14 isoform X2 n=1 Tax=Tripterygium wilfordii TaxID=458696 RepID=UPI0018F85CED|nr:probable ADP-ribosylation factor GTPase-activating protein AGD14 isoform X2 [Tripterygium wilfordii]